jgi:hypothetical protein
MAIPAAALFAVLTACGSSDAAPSAGGQQAPVAPAQQQQAPAQNGKKVEEPLTGELKQKAEAAALARYPGTVVKSEHDAEKPGMYAVEVKQTNGTSVEVYLDQSYTVTGTKDEGQDKGAGDTDGDG